MAMSRQQRRQMARQLAKTGDVQESIKRMEESAHEVADGVVDKLRKGAVEQAKAGMQEQMFVLFMAWAHVNLGFGKKRLTDLARSLNQFCNDMALENAKVDDLYDMIERETGLKSTELFKELSAEEDKRMAERRKEIKHAESVAGAI